MDLPIDSIEQGDNPRTDFDAQALGELADSIRSNGILQPLIVTPCMLPIGEAKVSQRFQLVAGERRWRAARLVGLKTVPCIIREVDDAQARRIALIENLQREDLNAVEEARGVAAILEAADGPTQRELAKQLGKSQSWIANRVRLLELPQCWLQAVISREITERHARAALAWTDHAEILQALFSRTKNAMAAGDPVTVEIFEEELIPEVVKSLSRPMDGPAGDGLIFDVKRNRRVKIFEPTPREEKDLGIVTVHDDVGGQKRATNIELWEKLQAAFLAEEDEGGSREDSDADGSGLQDTPPARSMMAATDESDDEDLPDDDGDNRSTGDRAPPKTQGPADLDVSRVDPWLRKLYAWKISWIRWLIARALRQHDATYVSDRLAVLALGDWDLIGWAPDATEAIQARMGKRGWKDCGTAIWRVPEHELPKVLNEVLAELFWREDHGEIAVVPHEQCEQILKAMEIDLEMQWSLEQAGDLSEAYWRLHTGADLIRLGKEMGVDLSETKSHEAMVEAFLARKPTPEDNAEEQGEKVLAYPKELKRLKKPPK
jgi:ParB/RepB/Spo0J family partition protein